MEEADAEVMQRWVNDLEGKVILQAIPRLRSKKETLAKGDHRETQEFMVETTDGRPIGLLQIFDIDWVHRHAEVNLLIGEPDHRGRGFEEDAIRVAASMAFRVLNLHRLGTSLVADNDRVRKVYEACGFKLEGVRESYCWVGDRYQDQVLYRLLAFEHRRPAGAAGAVS